MLLTSRSVLASSRKNRGVIYLFIYWIGIFRDTRIILHRKNVLTLTYLTMLFSKYENNYILILKMLLLELTSKKRRWDVTQLYNETVWKWKKNAVCMLILPLKIYAGVVKSVLFHMIWKPSLSEKESIEYSDFKRIEKMVRFFV